MSDAAVATDAHTWPSMERRETSDKRTDKNACFRVFRVDWRTWPLICPVIITFILSLLSL